MTDTVPSRGRFARGRHTRRAAAVALASTALILGDRPSPEPQSSTTLVVLLTVDQLRGDYLPRFERQLSGGLGRLMRGGAYFPNAFHDHALTETAPGHAAAWSGRHPANMGIISNERGVPDQAVRLVEASGTGASPHRFRGTMVFDWLGAHGAARALSVSRKDRGAILAIGLARESVYWFADEGRFTTSTYYTDTLPSWVRAFNARRLPERMAGREWTPLLPDSVYPEPDDQPREAGGRGYTFPHRLPRDSAEAARALIDFPWMDEVTLAFALAGVEAQGLGRGPATDVLAVSLSATDYIGHRYGPDSRELHDQVVRLDRALGAFLDSLYRLRDSARIVVALTGDHGVAPFPELEAERSGSATGHVTLRRLLSEVRQGLAAHGVPRRAFRLEGATLWVDREVFEAAGVNPDSVVTGFAAAVRAVPGVARADLVRELPSADTVRDVHARRWLHALPPDLPIELVVTLQPYWAWGSGTDAQHGTPHDYDAHVPLVLYGPPFRPGRYEDTVRVVDLAPTLAAGLGVTPAERVDGRVLSQALRPAGTHD